MQSMLAFAAPLAFILPILGQGTVEAVAPSAALTEEESSAAEQPGQSITASSLPLSGHSLQIWQSTTIARQVRIEQRVVVRISPQTAGQQGLLAQLPQRELAARYEERAMDSCVEVDGIAGVQTGRGNRLLLFLRDRRIITLNLEKACLARDFYSGFYIERNADGKLCVDRDKLQSRSGAQCEVDRMRQLVAVRD
ncbi:MAG: hypothetical protein ABJP48_00670 [Erythrobacter sp.]